MPHGCIRKTPSFPYRLDRISRDSIRSVSTTPNPNTHADSDNTYFSNPYRYPNAYRYSDTNSRTHEYPNADCFPNAKPDSYSHSASWRIRLIGTT